MILGVIELIIDFSNLLTSKEIKFCGIIVELIFAIQGLQKDDFREIYFC